MLDRVLSGILGALFVVALNIASDRIGTFGVGSLYALLTAVMIVKVLVWVRGRPEDAPIRSFAMFGLLGLALLAACTSAVAPKPWMLPTTLAAATLTLAAVLVTDELWASLVSLAGAAAVGLSVAVIGAAIVLLDERRLLDGVVVLGLGVAISVGWFIMLAERFVIVGTACIAGGAAIIALKAAGLIYGVGMFDTVLVATAVVIIGYGATIVWFWVTGKARALVLYGLMIIASAFIAAIAGVAALTEGFGLLPTLTCFVCAVGLLGFGVAVLAKHFVLFGVSIIALGGSGVLGGFAALAVDADLMGVAAAAGGLAFVGFGVAIVSSAPAADRIRSQLRIFVGDRSAAEGQR